jgi:hypothetical protein
MAAQVHKHTPHAAGVCPPSLPPLLPDDLFSYNWRNEAAGAASIGTAPVVAPGFLQLQPGMSPFGPMGRALSGGGGAGPNMA